MSQKGRRTAWLNRDLWLELGKKRKEKKRIFMKCGRRRGLLRRTTKRSPGCAERKLEAPKPKLKLNLTSAAKDNKKPHFYKYINEKRRTKENLSQLLDVGGNTVTRDEEKAELLNAFFALRL